MIPYPQHSHGSSPFRGFPTGLHCRLHSLFSQSPSLASLPVASAHYAFKVLCLKVEVVALETVSDFSLSVYIKPDSTDIQTRIQNKIYVYINMCIWEYFKTDHVVSPT